jgi:hypothetical protein
VRRRAANMSRTKAQPPRGDPKNGRKFAAAAATHARPAADQKANLNSLARGSHPSASQPAAPFGPGAGKLPGATLRPGRRRRHEWRAQRKPCELAEALECARDMRHLIWPLCRSPGMAGWPAGRPRSGGGSSERSQTTT